MKPQRKPSILVIGDEISICESLPCTEGWIESRQISPEAKVIMILGHAIIDVSL